MISLIAVLKAKPGQTDALRQALQALLLPTRQEPGNLDSALFQLRDAPDTFYMREAWQGQDALDAHVAMPYFQAFMTQMDPVLEEVADVKTAVSEAVTNSIIHGYEGRTSGKITVWCGIEKDKKTILVTVKDQGIGIENVEQAMEPLYTTRPDMDRSGMGFAFMEAFMDEVQVESVPGKGTTVWMKKTTGGEKKEAVWTTQSH